VHLVRALVGVVDDRAVPAWLIQLGFRAIRTTAVSDRNNLGPSGLYRLRP